MVPIFTSSTLGQRAEPFREHELSSTGGDAWQHNAHSLFCQYVLHEDGAEGCSLLESQSPILSRVCDGPQEFLIK